MRFIRRIIRSVYVFAGISCILLLILLVCTPAILDSPPLLRLVREASGLDDLSWQVRRTGLTGADIGRIRIGPADREALLVNTIQADYSLTGLLQGRLSCIRISGLEFYCGVREGRFFIRGLDLASRTSGSAPSDSQPPPICPDRLEIRHAAVMFEWNGNTYPVPFTCDLRFSPSGMTEMDGTLVLSPCGQDMVLDFYLDTPENIIDIKVRAENFHTERFCDLISKTVPGLFLSGPMDIKAHAAAGLSPFDLSEFQAQFRFNSENSGFGPVRLAAGSPLVLDIGKEAGKPVWKAGNSGLALAAPAPLSFSRIEAEVKQLAEGITCTGTLDAGLVHDDKNTSGIPEIIKPLMTANRFSAEISPDGMWQFSLENDVPKPEIWEIGINDIKMSGKTPAISIKGKGISSEGQITCALEIPEYRLESSSASVKARKITLNATAHLSGSVKSATQHLTLAGAEAGFGTIRLGIPSADLSGNWAFPESEPPRFEGILSLSDSVFQESGSAVKIQGIRGNLPLRWPWAESGKKGSISAAAIRCGKFDIGSLKGRLQQIRDGLGYGGTVRSGLLPGLKLEIDGASGFMAPDAPTQVTVKSAYKTRSPTDLKKFIPAAKGLTFDGALKTELRFESGASGSTCRLDAAIENSSLHMAPDIKTEGLDLKLAMADLIHLRSLPGQQATIKRIEAGNITLTDAAIRFQIESPDSFLAEKSQFDWCSGRVNSQAIRILPGVDDYDLTLYCDRLNFAEVLKQLGAAEAEGKGTVNGRIPVRFRDGDFSFDDGFLYSTPGDGGTIHLGDSDILTRSIPVGTPQAGQLDLAIEALKHYEYDWVKMRLASQAEKLMLYITFNGRPASPLPFVYDDEAGGFVRVKPGGVVSRFEGILLNVNLSLPLNRILRYKGAFDAFNPK